MNGHGETKRERRKEEAGGEQKAGRAVHDKAPETSKSCESNATGRGHVDRRACETIESRSRESLASSAGRTCAIQPTPSGSQNRHSGAQGGSDCAPQDRLRDNLRPESGSRAGKFSAAHSVDFLAPGGACLAGRAGHHSRQTALLLFAILHPLAATSLGARASRVRPRRHCLGPSLQHAGNA